MEKSRVLSINRVSAYLFLSATAAFRVRACSSSVLVQSFALYFKSGETVELLSDVLCLGHCDKEKWKKLEQNISKRK